MGSGMGSVERMTPSSQKVSSKSKELPVQHRSMGIKARTGYRVTGKLPITSHSREG